MGAIQPNRKWGKNWEKDYLTHSLREVKNHRKSKGGNPEIEARGGGVNPPGLIPRWSERS